MTKDTTQLSLRIAREISYCCDRWNPVRMRKVEIMISKLKEKLVEEMGYTEEAWENACYCSKSFGRCNDCEKGTSILPSCFGENLKQLSCKECPYSKDCEYLQ